jgi:hypothetical protein
MKFAALLLLVAAVGCGTTHPVSQVSDTVPSLKIVKVVVNTDSTRIDFRYQASGATRRVGVHAPSDEGAFAIRSLDGKKIYRLTGVDGIAVLPERSTVEDGTSLDFALTFEPIPKSMTAFQVGEGAFEAEPGESTWRFQKVSLKG